MIYTVTFNPSLDYIVSVPNFELGKTNRTVYEQMLAGGKGINVTTVLRNLGIDSTALGFVAGFTGDELIRRMDEMGLKNDFIRIGNGFSRINLKLKDVDGTEINGMGPVIDQAGQDALMDKLNTLKEGDTLVLAGSIPESMPGTIYSNILEALQGRGIRFVVDATKDLLVNVLKYHPLTRKSFRKWEPPMSWYPCPAWARCFWMKMAEFTRFPLRAAGLSTRSAQAIPWSRVS